MDARVVGAEPFALAAAEAPGGAGHGGDGVEQRELAAQVGEHLAVADRVEAGRVFGQALAQQHGDLLDEAGAEHCGGALVDATVERLLRVGRSVGAEAQRAALALPAGDRAAGSPVDFERADDAAQVVGRDAAGGVGIDAGEVVVQGGRAARFRVAGQLVAEGVIGRCGWDDPAFEQRPDVLPAAAHDQRELAAVVDVGDRRAGGVEVFGERDRFGGIAQVEAVVRDQGAVGRRRFGGADFEAAVELAGVGADDFGVEPLREFERPGGLAGGGGTDDGEDGVIAGGRLRRRRCGG